MDKRTLIFIFSLTVALFLTRLGFEHYNEKNRQEWVQTHGKELAQKKLQPAATNTPKEPEKQFEATKSGRAEQFYVLENNYQQLVFSSRGGALVEINLPFKTESNTKSVVLPIEFDRELKVQSPNNTYFPLQQALQSTGEPKTRALGGYYPLLRRNQIMANQTLEIPARNYSCNIISEYPEVAELTYEVKKFTDSEIVFEATQAHRRITKRFSFIPNPDDAPYCLQLEVKVEGDSRGLWLTSGVPEVEWISGSSGAIIKYNLLRGKTSTVEKIDLPKDTFTLTSVAPDWICNSNGFFGIIVDPLEGSEAGFKAARIEGNITPSRLHLIDLAYDRFPLKDLPGFDIQVPLKQTTQTMRYRLFTGPFDDVILTKADAYYAAEQGGRDSDYLACQTFHGWFSFISEPFAKFLFFLMKLFYKFFGSWALSIFLITCVLRLLLYPLNTWSLKSMKRMQMIAPEIKAIQERHKKDPQKAQQEIVALYREYGVNPLSGCLPLLIQMPFLIGMFDLLKSSFELRGASFIPGWINDLSAPDVLFSWDYPLPLIGNEFHLLPFLLGGIMFMQQNMMSSMPKDRSQWTDQQRQQRAMGNMMTVVMTVMFYQFPSGLNIYWISSMALSMVQQWWTNRSMDKQPVVLPAAKSQPKTKSK